MIANDDLKRSYWQLIFVQSRANGCFYDVEDLPHAIWQWPKNTWFQHRLNYHSHALEPAMDEQMTNEIHAERRAHTARLKVGAGRSDSAGYPSTAPLI